MGAAEVPHPPQPQAGSWWAIWAGTNWGPSRPSSPGPKRATCTTCKTCRRLNSECCINMHWQRCAPVWQRALTIRVLKPCAVAARSSLQTLPCTARFIRTRREYFNPCSVDHAAGVIGAVIAVGAQTQRAQMRERGRAVALQYLPQNILPKWAGFEKR